VLKSFFLDFQYFAPFETTALQMPNSKLHPMYKLVHGEISESVFRQINYNPKSMF